MADDGTAAVPAGGGRREGLAPRLLSAMVLVVLVGALTAWLVATAVAPGLFAHHMREAGPSVTAEATQHAQEAFASANAISLSVALLAALAASVAVSVYLTRRLGRALRPLSRAAADVGRGHYDVQLTPPGVGTEFDDLTAAFNHMASRLHRVEDTRRRLLADLAHELRTPIATLDAYLEALDDGVLTLDGDTSAVLRAQTARLTRLAQDVAAVSEAEEPHVSLRRMPTSAKDLALAAQNAAAEQYAAKGVTLRCEVAEGLPALSVDRDRMEQVLANLLDNALRYTPPGGSVTVAAARDRGLVRFQVVDTGEGISAEHLPHVFDRFYRADAARDRAHGGSGIGLAIVKALVEAHQGRVGAASPGPGQGATFTIWLPAIS